MESITFNKRDYKYDNLRGFAIVLMVSFHLLDPFFNFPVCLELGKLIMVVIMPTLFFISGYFSKVDENTEIKAFKGAFIPYLLFCTFWMIFSFFILGWSVPKSPYLVPSAGLWYLLSLFLMRLLLPILVKTKHIFWILVACSLLIGLISLKSNFLSILKFTYYLPIFLFGYYFKNRDQYFDGLNLKIKKIIMNLRGLVRFKINKKVAFLLLVLVFVVTAVVVKDFPSNFYSFERSYSQMDVSGIMGMTMRVFSLFSSIAVILLLNRLITDKKSVLTKIGVNSLAIYVLHFYFIKTLETYFLDSSLGSFLHGNIYLVGVYILACTLIIVFILSRDFVSAYLKKLTDFFVKIFVKTY